MASAILTHDYNGFVIPQRESDGYVSLTKMAAAYPSKRMGHFLENKQTNAYLAALSENIGIPTFNLILAKQGRGGGTWAHPEVSIKFAAWLSPEFEVWAMRTIRDVIENAPSSTIHDHALPAKPVEERMEKLANSMSMLGLLNDPRLQAIGKDLVMGWMSKEVGMISGDSTAEPLWQSAAEIAEDLGYNAIAVQKVRAQLGKAVAHWYRTDSNSEPTKEKRPCNGTMRPCNVYQRSLDLDASICEWLDAQCVSRATMQLA